MAKKLDDQAQTRLATGALFAALVQTLGEQDKSFPSRFEEKLERLYRTMRDGKSGPLLAMETLRWTREMLKEFRS